MTTEAHLPIGRGLSRSQVCITLYSLKEDSLIPDTHISRQPCSSSKEPPEDQTWTFQFEPSHLYLELEQLGVCGLQTPEQFPLPS